MSPAVQTPCSHCGAACKPGLSSCERCRLHLRVAHSPLPSRSAAPARAPAVFPSEPKQPAQYDSEQREAWKYLGLGLLTAPIFGLTPLLSYMGWFLASLVHEMGHASFAWLCGMPAAPAISLTGHAAAFHSEQQPILVLAIWALLLGASYHYLRGPWRIGVCIAVACVYPAIAWTPAKELLHLLAGHGAELVFSAWCLWKTLDGGFTHSRLERALYGTVGWYLLGKNVALCWGLMTSAQARGEYASNGSFGLTNDYLRAANDVLGWSLGSVSFGMLLMCLLVLPVAILAWRVTQGLRAGH